MCCACAVHVLRGGVCCAVWNDTRTAEVVKRLTRRFGMNHFRPVSGLPISTYFSAVKLVWLSEEPTVSAAIRSTKRVLFGTVDSYLIWRLTGGRAHVTDVTNASRTLLMDLNTRQWHQPTRTALGIDPHITLPTIKSSAELIGTIEGTELDGIRISGVSPDTQ
jgi:glycerol kinase